MQFKIFIALIVLPVILFPVAVNAQVPGVSDLLRVPVILKGEDIISRGIIEAQINSIILPCVGVAEAAAATAKSLAAANKANPTPANAAQLLPALATLKGAAIACDKADTLLTATPPVDSSSHYELRRQSGALVIAQAQKELLESSIALVETLFDGIIAPCLLVNNAVQTSVNLLAITADAGIVVTGASAADVANYKINLKLLETAVKTCDIVETAVTAVVMPIDQVGVTTVKTNTLKKIDARRQSLKHDIDVVKFHLSNSKKVFWKAVFTRVFLTISKTMISRLVSSLNSKYKIGNFGQYVNAVGSLVYQAQAIKNTSDDQVSQAMMRSMITDNTFVNQYHPAAQAAAYFNLGFDVKDINANSPDLLPNIFKLGLCSNNVDCIDANIRSASAVAASSARNNALTETAQSSYKSPRDCDGAIMTEQTKLDTDYQKRAKEVQELQAQYLKFANKQPKTKENDENAKEFYNAYKAGLESLNKFPREVKNPVLEVCKGIISPAEFIGGRIGKMIDEQVKKISDQNPDNLQLAISSIADIGSTFATKWLLGIGQGGSASSKTTVIDESSRLVNGVASDIDFQTEGLGDTVDDGDAPPDDDTGGTQSKIKLDYTRGQAEGEITITWDATERKNAESVKLEGPGVGADASAELKGSYKVIIKEDSTFTLTVFVDADAKNPEPKVKTLVVPLKDTGGVDTRGGDGTTPDGGPGQVQSAFISLHPIMPRGMVQPRN